MEHAVIARLPLIEDPFGSEREREIIADLAGELQHAIGENGVGEFKEFRGHNTNLAPAPAPALTPAFAVRADAHR